MRRSLTILLTFLIFVSLAKYFSVLSQESSIITTAAGGLGNGNLISITPTETANYNNASRSVLINVQNPAQTPGIITTVAGGGNFDGVAATNMQMNGPEGVSIDGAGNVYIAATGNHRIHRIDSTGISTTVVGTGSAFIGTGDGGPATNAILFGPITTVVDSAGNLYIVDIGINRIRRVDAATGIISTFAGTGIPFGLSGDGGPATSPNINPTGVALDSAGNLYIADTSNNRIRKVNAATGIISTVAGNGTAGYNGDGVLATQTRLSFPNAVAIDSEGNIYIADNNNNRIRRVDAATGIITTVAGNGTAGFSGDGGPATK